MTVVSSVYKGDSLPENGETLRPRHRRTPTGFGRTEMKRAEANLSEPARRVWHKYAMGEIETKEQFQAEFVRHVETTLARSPFNCDEL